MALHQDQECQDQNERTAISFVICVSDNAILHANLLASPCCSQPGPPHEFIVVQNPPDAAYGLNGGIAQAKNPWVVCVHQDVYLPEGWDKRIIAQLEQAERQFGPIGVAGVYGVGHAIERPRHPLAAQRIGHVIDRGRMLQDGPDLPGKQLVSVRFAP